MLRKNKPRRQLEWILCRGKKELIEEGKKVIKIKRKGEKMLFFDYLGGFLS